MNGLIRLTNKLISVLIGLELMNINYGCKLYPNVILLLIANVADIP